VARIDSYFFLPTDLAAGFRAWPEFMSGEGYSVELASATERVVVNLVAAWEDDCQHVVVEEKVPVAYFRQSLGRSLMSWRLTATT
jgi:hypothetical protein